MAHLQLKQNAISLRRMRVILVHVHHSIEESPEEDVGEKTSNQAPGEEEPSGFKTLVPSSSGLENEQQRQKERGQKVKNEAIQSRQAQDTGGSPGQRWHGGAAVVQHGGIAPHGHFADELRPLSFGYDGCHFGCGRRVTGRFCKECTMRLHFTTKIRCGG